MNRLLALALLLLPAVLVYQNSGDSTQNEVVTNPPTALSATMSSATDALTGCTTWTARGKVKPTFRSEGGTTVRLVCTAFCALNGNCGAAPPPTLVFPQCLADILGSCPPAPVDSCGKFSFTVATVCPPQLPQLDPGYSCNFVVHTDLSKGAPQSCASGNANQPPPADPNGSAPCSGGYCPVSP
jgi:hypothetical protein